MASTNCLHLYTEVGQDDFVDPFEPTYVEPQDTYRGCTLPGFIADMPFAADMHFAADDVKSCSTRSTQSVKSSVDDDGSHAAADKAGRVRQLELPSVLCPPEVPFGGLLSTSVSLRHVLAADAMKVVHALLLSQSGTVVTEICSRKCSLTAEVILDTDGWLSQCTIAVHIFNLTVNSQEACGEAQQIAVEFTRESGDTFAFAHMFGLAQERLQTLARQEPSSDAGVIFGPSYSLPKMRDLLWPVEHGCVAVADDLQPLVDMLHDQISPGQQAEALAGLATVARRGVDVVTSANAARRHLQGVLANLVASPALELAYLASHVAAGLELMDQD